MMKQLLSLAALGLSLCLSACGNVEAGESCSPDNTATCSSSTEALWCEGGKLRTIPCSGPAGCGRSSGNITCDFSRAQAGDACPGVAEAKVQCAVASPDEALRCSGGTWTTLTCKGCTVQDGTIVCAQ
jgi:hypothetical protein